MAVRTASARTGEILPLTSLRMVAALLVFLHHFAGLVYLPNASDVWRAFAIEGHIGVTIFFVLSGFLITHRYYEEVVQGTLKLYDYVVRRIARIFPLYFFLLVVTLVILEKPLFTRQTLVNWVLLQGYFTELRYSGISTAWSLTVEESFYVLAPCILWLCVRATSAGHVSRTRQMLTVGAVLTATVVIFFTLGSALIAWVHTAQIWVNSGFMADFPIAAYSTLFFRIFDFACGIFCARLYHLVMRAAWERPHAQTAAVGLMGASVIAMLALTWGMNQNGGIYQPNGWIFNYGVAVASAVLILALTCPGTWIAQLMSLPLPVYLGRISYAFYLIQGTPLVSDLAPLPFTAIGLVARYVTMNAISAVLYETVEKWGSEAVRAAAGWIRSRVQKPVSAPALMQ